MTHPSCSLVATKLATPFRFPPVSEIFKPLHSFHSFRPYTHPTYAALKRLLHLPSFLYVSCRLLTSSHTASFSTTQTKILCRSLAQSRQPRSRRGHVALHHPAPARARAGHGPPGSLPIGSGRLGVLWPTRPRLTRDPSPVPLSGPGRLGLPADRRLGPTRIPSSSHVT